MNHGWSWLKGSGRVTDTLGTFALTWSAGPQTWYTWTNLYLPLKFATIGVTRFLMQGAALHQPPLHPVREMESVSQKKKKKKVGIRVIWFMYRPWDINTLWYYSNSAVDRLTHDPDPGVELIDEFASIHSVTFGMVGLSLSGSSGHKAFSDSILFHRMSWKVLIVPSWKNRLFLVEVFYDTLKWFLKLER